MTQDLYHLAQFLRLHPLRESVLQNTLRKITDFVCIGVALRKVDSACISFCRFREIRHGSVLLIQHTLLPFKGENGFLKLEPETGRKGIGRRIPGGFSGDEKFRILIYYAEVVLFRPLCAVNLRILDRKSVV